MFTGLVVTICLISNVYAEPILWSVSEGGNGHLYEVVSVLEGITWGEANILAEQKGGHLATITSQEENTFVFSLINDAQYWNVVMVDPCWDDISCLAL